MASLKDLRNRIRSVKATQKITKAMKMVAASKLRRAREAAESARPYAERMERMLSALSASIADPSSAPLLLTGNGKDDTHLLIIATSDRGLCGSFNGSIVKAARRRYDELKLAGKAVKIFCIGRKGYELLRRTHGSAIIGKMEDVTKDKPSFDLANEISAKLLEMYEAGEFDKCTVVYNTFKSAISQIVTFKQVIPLNIDASAKDGGTLPTYEYEPKEEVILDELLPKNLAMQVFHSLLENSASEQGARMTAMDNATRNAGDMIKKLNLVYNRTRQAAITKELIEIISGADAI